MFKNHDAAVAHESGTNMLHNVRKNAIMGLLRVQINGLTSITQNGHYSEVI